MNELMTTKMKKVKNKKGFTLIELIVVIAILGILAAIAIPRLGGFRESAQDSANEATATTILNAAEVYFVQEGKLVPAGTGTGATTLIDGLIEANLLRDGDYTGFTLTPNTTTSTDPDYGTYNVGYDGTVTGAPGGKSFTIGN